MRPFSLLTMVIPPVRGELIEIRCKKKKKKRLKGFTVKPSVSEVMNDWVHREWYNLRNGDEKGSMSARLVIQ
jgi:hypothetical protein